MKTKLFSLLLAVAASVGTMFANGTKIGDLYFNLNATNQTAKVTCELLWDENNYKGLTTANIPASVTYSGTTYSVTSIGSEAFYECSSLTSVTIPNSVTSIGDDAFYDCSSLTSVTIPNSVTFIGLAAFCNCSSLTSVTIPNSVTSIGYEAFRDCSGLTSVEIPNSVTRIGDYAFYKCSSLTSVTIPNSVTRIGDYAFYKCSSLTSVTIPNSVTSIGVWAFLNCRIASINFTGTIEEWCNKSWSPTQISSGYQLFINGVFQENVTIPNSVTSIGDEAFRGCSSLTSVTIGNSVTSIGGDAFYGCRIASINFTGTIEEWCNKSWSPTQISSEYQLSINGEPQENVIIPNSVTNIGGNAFNGCSNLKNILFGTSVKFIEASAISNCPALETITCYSMRPPTVNNGTFQTLPNNIIIFVPADYLNTYKMHDFWGMYDVRPIGAATTETTSVQVTPSETAATVAWPTISGAETYEMVIKDKNGNIVCTLIFNANGQLTEIAFNAPARNDAIEQTQAAGFAFTVTGLEEGTSYDLTITAKDGNGTTLDEKTIAFNTTGGTGVEDINVPATSESSTKILRNGEVLILRDGKTYTLQGVEVR